MLFHQLHRMAYFVVYPITTASVVGFLESLKADCRNEVPDSEHLLAEIFVDHRSVCKREELTVRVHLADLKDVFSCAPSALRRYRYTYKSPVPCPDARWSQYPRGLNYTDGRILQPSIPYSSDYMR